LEKTKKGDKGKGQPAQDVVHKSEFFHSYFGDLNIFQSAKVSHLL